MERSIFRGWAWRGLAHVAEGGFRSPRGPMIVRPDHVQPAKHHGPVSPALAWWGVAVASVASASERGQTVPGPAVSFRRDRLSEL